jgi:hypothetical protein
MASIINASSTGSGGIVQTADASGVLQLQSNGTVALTVSNGTSVAINASSLVTFGNGQGLQIGSNAFVYNQGATYAMISQNGYQGASGDVYATTGLASRYYQGAGQHTWSSAVSGTAGTTCTFNTIMNLTSGGLLTTPNRTQFWATRTGSEQTITSNPTTLLFNSASQNTGSAYNTSTGIFTAPVAGVYAFSLSARFDNSTNDGYGRAGLAINGGNASWTYGQQIYTIGTSSNYVSYNTTLIIKLSANDTVNAQWGGSDTSTNMTQESCFSGCLIG